MLYYTKRFVQQSKYKILFFAMGFGALIWFLIRVIPKPSRATYPCMRVAAPMASSLVLYIIGLGSVTLLFRKAKDKFYNTKYLVASVLALSGLIVGVLSQITYNVQLNAQPLITSYIPNEPIGEGVGIYPGRVVWVYNPDVTNDDCTNEEGDYWFDDYNTNLVIVKEMLSSGIRDLTGKATDVEAWEAIFKHFNGTKGRGDNGYKAGEKIVIKTNLNGIYNDWTSKRPKNINTSPQITYAILDQLIKVAGVASSDIWIGDPNCPMNDETYDYCSSSFPGVNYWGNGPGRKAPIQSANSVFFASDGSTNDYLPQEYIDATYLINIPVFKKHHRAGISISSKNHFGSIAPFTGGAWHLHPSLPCPEATAIADNGDYGSYRCFVDIMGHKHLGGKTILYLVDGLWGSTNWGHPPVKFRMTPFNNDWPSSLFLSQDPVAIESVCYDFLFKEFDETHPTEGKFVGDDKGPYPHFPGTDDFLQQAADPSLWPAGIVYDPENDGTTLTSMGVYEHWNNDVDKQYSRNLGKSEGIELYRNFKTGIINKYLSDQGALINSIYPNPFNEYATIGITFKEPSSVEINIFNTSGVLVYSKKIDEHLTGTMNLIWEGIDNNGTLVSSGQYLINLTVRSKSGVVVLSDKVLRAR